MKKFKDEIVPVTITELINELEDELNYLKDGGSEYRIKTAELSLKIAKEINNVTPFFDRNNSLEVVSRLLQNEDDERRYDVAKMLNVITKSTYKKLNYTDEYKESLRQRATGWKLVLIDPKKDKES